LVCVLFIFIIEDMNIQKYQKIKHEIPENVRLIAVSKTKPESDILQLYELGQRIFGENKAQELKQKHENLPKDIAWHFIGHLQTNKIKYIIPFVHLIHSIDSFNLLKEVNKQALKNNRQVSCLLQFHVATEETKYGFSFQEAVEMLQNPEFENLKNVSIVGIMGMASLTDDRSQIRREFSTLYSFFEKLKATYFKGKDSFKEISMGMTDDYDIAIEEGATLIRVGSAIFGERNYNI